MKFHGFVEGDDIGFGVVLGAIAEGGGSLFVSGVDPGWGNDVLPVLVSGLSSTVESIRCQEIFDYSTYDAEESVRFIVGMGQPMDYEPMMTSAGIPSMVWGGQVRLIARALGVEVGQRRRPLRAGARSPRPGRRGSARSG